MIPPTCPVTEGSREQSNSTNERYNKMNCKCNNCDWEGDSSLMSGIAGIQGLFERISPGEIVPAGECPKCGCLTHPVVESPEKQKFPSHISFHVVAGILVADRDLFEKLHSEINYDSGGDDHFSGTVEELSSWAKEQGEESEALTFVKDVLKHIGNGQAAGVNFYTV